MNSSHIVASDAAQGVSSAASESHLTARPDPLLSLFERLARRAPTGMTLSIASLGLAACGDDDDGSSNVAGNVVKGPLSNALVFLDYDDNGVMDAGEPSTRTTADGGYTLASSNSNFSIVAITDGSTIDTASGTVLDGITLKAPSGASVVTPATTLMEEGNLTAEQVALVLGFPVGVDPTSFNPYADGVDAEDALAVEQASQQIMSVITAFAGALEGAGASESSAFSAALQSIASTVQAKAAANETLDLASTEDIALIQTALRDEVSNNSNLSAVNTTALDAMIGDTASAIKNVNSAIAAITSTDLTSTASKNIFSTVQVLKDQVEAAAAAEVIAEGSGNIAFTEASAVVTAAANSAPSDLMLDNSVISEAAESLMIGVVTTEDDEESGFVYSIAEVSGTDFDKFTINSSTGELSLTEQPDFETKASYSVVVKSVDAGGKALSKTFNISVTDDVDNFISLETQENDEGPILVTFTGNTGPITVEVVPDETAPSTFTATFSRGGQSVTVLDVGNKAISLADNQTLSVDLETYQALGSTDGDGTVEITITDEKIYQIAASSKFWVAPNDIDSTDAQDFMDNELNEYDVVYLPSGNYNFDVTVNVDNVTLLGANFGEAVHGLSEGESFVGVAETAVAVLDREDVAQEIRDDLVKFDTSASPRELDESWISGKITVAASGVTLDGLRLNNAEGGLAFSATGDANIDDFALLNSYLTGHAAGSIRFADADYVFDQESGAMTGEASSGWRIEGNLIGGVSTSSSNGGSLYLTGLAESSISGNVFWRPGAAHLYLEDLTDVTLENNFFYHGMHAGGANFDGLLGGVGNGYGYGYGYGTDTGYGYGYGGSGSGYGYGYGTDNGYGYGYGGYGYGGNGGAGPFFGRNYWLELKGVNDGVTFSDNLGLFNSGGIQVWDEDSTLNKFSDITISGNIFAMSINADPSGYLDSISGTSRHKSGIMGGVVWSTEDESLSSGLIIDGNYIESDIGQIMNDGDIMSLILIQGGVDGVEIEGNTLSWDWLTNDGSVPPGATAGIMLSRTLIGGDVDPDQFVVDIDGNTFSHTGIDELPSGSDYSWVGVYLDVTSPNDLPFEDMARLGLNNQFEISPVDASLEDLLFEVSAGGETQLASLISAKLYPFAYPFNAAPEQAYDDDIAPTALVFSF